MSLQIIFHFFCEIVSILFCKFLGTDTGHTGNSSLPTDPQYGGRDGPLQVRGVFQEGVRNHHGSHQGQQGVLAQVDMVVYWLLGNE